MSIPCPVEACDQKMPGTSQICNACSGQLARHLAEIPFLSHQLDLTLARQNGRGAGGRSTTTPLPYDQRASLALHWLRSVLASWVILLSTDDWPADQVPAMARWLLARHQHLARHPAAVEALDEIGDAVRRALRVIDRPPECWYAGPCWSEIAPGVECGTDIYALPGAVTVRCPCCHADWSVGERRVWLLQAAEDTLAYGALIAQALTSLGQEVTPERIRQWAKRGRIVAHGTDSRGRPQYRVGDVMGLLAGQREKVAL